MDSICRFIPAKKGGEMLKTIHFVYETEFKKLKQPFIQPIYYVYLVTRGCGTLEMLSVRYELREGSLFFAFPGVSYTVDGSDDLAYMYISFMGMRAFDLAKDAGLDETRPVYDSFTGEIPFWKESIQRINPKNANVLTECVLLHTLSFLNCEDGDIRMPKSRSVLENIVNYVENNYADPDLSLKKVAAIFAYTDKYLSHLFKENMNVNWNTYLTRLRMQHALALLDEGKTDLPYLAAECGYRDVLYFSKVFKRHTGMPPREYLRQKKITD